LIYKRRMLPTDEQVRKAVWEGLIPVVFTLTPNEVITFQPPIAFYAAIPRNSYLPLVANGVREHFLLSAPVVVDEMWFDYNGTPLRWHVPIGVLFDQLCPPGGASDLPWALTVHFQGFPATQLLRCPNDSTVRDQITNTLKEANFIKHGDNNKVNKLSLSESNAWWDGLRTNDYDMFWSSNKMLSADYHTMKNVPIRVSTPLVPTLQDLVVPRDELGNERTLASVLYQLLPESFPLPSVDVIPPNANSTSVSNSVITQGITPPLEATIVWLYEQFSHPDNFLYIIIRPTS